MTSLANKFARLVKLCQDERARVVRTVAQPRRVDVEATVKLEKVITREAMASNIEKYDIQFKLRLSYEI